MQFGEADLGLLKSTFLITEFGLYANSYYYLIVFLIYSNKVFYQF